MTPEVAKIWLESGSSRGFLKNLQNCDFLKKRSSKSNSGAQNKLKTAYFWPKISPKFGEKGGGRLAGETIDLTATGTSRMCGSARELRWRLGLGGASAPAMDGGGVAWVGAPVD